MLYCNSNCSSTVCCIKECDDDDDDDDDDALVPGGNGRGAACTVVVVVVAVDPANTTASCFACSDVTMSAEIRPTCKHTRTIIDYFARNIILLMTNIAYFIFTARCTIVHSAVLRLPAVRPSVRLSVCDVGGSGSHRLEILETNCTVN